MIKMQKPDLYTVLTRRKRTVESFLENKKIRSIEQLNDFIDTSNGFQYEYSKSFFEKAYEYFAKLEEQRKKREHEQNAKLEAVAKRKAAVDNIRSEDDSGDEVEITSHKNVVKRTKKKKKASKTTVSGSNG